MIFDPSGGLANEKEGVRFRDDWTGDFQIGEGQAADGL